MAMHNPPHPGEFILTVYLEPHGMAGRELASRLGVSPSTLNRVLTGKSGISPEMAMRLTRAFGSTEETWFRMQFAYDLAEARKHARKIKAHRQYVVEVNV